MKIDMIFAHGGDISIAISKPFLKLIGYWVAADRDELSRRNLAVVYTVLAICIIGVISVIDLFHSMDNSSVSVQGTESVTSRQ